MRVGIDASNLRGGGGRTHLAQLLGAADPIRHEFESITVWGGEQTLKLLPSGTQWLRLCHVKSLDSGLMTRSLWQRLVLPRLAEKEADVLFSPGGTLPRCLVPSVTMCRNMLPFEPAELARFGLASGRLHFHALRRLQLESFRRASAVIFLTEYARENVMRYGGIARSKVEIIPHGVDERFRMEPRQQRELGAYSDSKPFRLLYVSTVNQYKHQWNVVDAVGGLKSKGLPIFLTLIGGGTPNALAKLERARRRWSDVGPFMEYLGRVPFSEVHQQYHKADGVVYASSCENLPNILLEAMAAALPIACSDRGPMPEVLGNCGAYFDPESVASIERSLQELLESKELRERYSRDARARALGYTWERCASATFQFLNHVLRSAG